MLNLWKLALLDLSAGSTRQVAECPHSLLQSQRWIPRSVVKPKHCFGTTLMVLMNSQLKIHSSASSIIIPLSLLHSHGSPRQEILYNHTRMSTIRNPSIFYDEASEPVEGISLLSYSAGCNSSIRSTVLAIDLLTLVILFISFGLPYQLICRSCYY